MKSRQLKLYYRRLKTLLTSEDKKSFEYEGNLKNINKHVLLYGTCLSVLPRIIEKSYQEKGIIYIDDILYQTIKKEINHPELPNEEDYINILNYNFERFMSLRSRKYEESDIILFAKESKVQMEKIVLK